MTKDEMMDLLLGVAIVALGYAIYKQQHRYGQGAPIPNIPAAPAVQQDGQGNYFFDMDKLFEGVL